LRQPALSFDGVAAQRLRRQGPQEGKAIDEAAQGAAAEAAVMARNMNAAMIVWDQTPAGSEDKRTANRKLRLRDVAEILEERGLEPIGAICDVLPELDPGMRVKTLLSLAEFVHPKLGRTVITGPNGGAIEHVHRVELVALSADSTDSPTA
jgi:hypothetical protein